MAKSRTEPVLQIREFPGRAALGPLVTPPSSSTQVHVDQLKAGILSLQRCTHCDRQRYPVAPVCPYCGDSSFEWAPSAGTGLVVSWVRYPRSYLAAFNSLIPYVVVCVELSEGPRMFGRLVDTDVKPRIGMRVRAVIERWTDGGHAPAFVFAGGD
jgi:uncharacterized protein